MSICFFIGHHNSPIDVYPALLNAVQQHITEHGVTEFLVGHYGSFDSMAARAVTEIKPRYPHIRLTMLLPYHPAERAVIIPDGFDGSIYPPDMERVPRNLAIVRANQYAIRQADYLIAYVRFPGNARNLLESASKKSHSSRITML